MVSILCISQATVYRNSSPKQWFIVTIGQHPPSCRLQGHDHWVMGLPCMCQVQAGFIDLDTPDDCPTHLSACKLTHYTHILPMVAQNQERCTPGNHFPLKFNVILYAKTDIHNKLLILLVAIPKRSMLKHWNIYQLTIQNVLVIVFSDSSHKTHCHVLQWIFLRTHFM